MIMIFNELLLLPKPVALLFLGIASLLVGSFLNVVIYRLPLILNAAWRQQCSYIMQLPEEPEPLTLSFPRSHCIQCKTKIPFWHTIPLFSYCLLRGRCHHCSAPISIRYPLVEGLCCGLSVLAGLLWGAHITLLFALLFIWIIITLSFIDLEHQLLPDSLTIGLLWLGLLANTQQLFTPLSNAVLSAAGAYISLWLFAKLFQLVTGKIGMGHGDFKLFAAFGAWFGWTALPFILFTGSAIGAIVGLTYLKLTHQTKETPIPFGPFLSMAGIFALFLLTMFPQICSRFIN